MLENDNGVVADKYVNNIWQNPYTEKKVFAMAAPILIYKSLSFQVTLPSSLWYSNDSASVQSIEIDFGDGAGYQTMALGQIRTITYPQSAVYEWKYRLTLANLQVLYSHSKLKIDVPILENAPPSESSTNLPPGQTCDTIATILFAGTRQYLGVANTATLQIDFAQNDCVIKKPLIVVEGFDSGLLGVENAYGENNYITFVNSIFESLSYNLSTNVFQYDIIYINFNQGRDDLRRNAYLVEDIIDWVNSQKAQSGNPSPNVVIGQSMGGVIARYALRDMEIQNRPHDTSLYVSHDAPHQGANIPIGVQFFARHLADQFVETPAGDYAISIGDGANISIADIEELFESTGTRQLLSNYIDSGFGLDNSVFDAFKSELKYMGYPTLTRNIAISNGNHCAYPQEFEPSDLLFGLTGGASTTALSTFLTVMVEPLTGISSAPLAYEFNEPGLLLSMLPGSSSFLMNFYAKALPTAGTIGQVYHGDISFTKKIFSFIGWNPQITTNLTERDYYNPTLLSYDYYPGGQYRLPFQFEPENLYPNFINQGIYVYLTPSFNFIPVPSALDVGSGGTVLTNTDYLTSYNKATPPVGSKAIPFDNFTTSFPNKINLNEPHISFNTRNGNWLATELDSNLTNNQFFDCTFFCDYPEFSGLENLCDIMTYSATPIAGATYNWSLEQPSGVVALLSGNGTPNVTLTKTGNGSGYVTLTLTVSTQSCGTVTRTKEIWCGLPAFNFVRDSNEFCDERGHHVIYIIHLPPDSTFTLDSINPQPLSVNYGPPYYGADPNSITFRYGGGFSGNISFAGTATNDCGDYQAFSEQNSFVSTCGILEGKIDGDNASLYKVYPNPATDALNIDIREDIEKTTTNPEIKATLHDMLGEQRAVISIDDDMGLIPITNLPRGVYILRIDYGGSIENHKVIIK